MERKKKIKTQISDDAFFENMVNYYIHQNGLMWSRLQTALALQSVFLIAVINIKGCLGIMISFLNAVVTVVLYIFMTRDRKIRDEVENKIKEIPGFIINTNYWSWAKSKNLALAVFVMFVIANFTISFYLLLEKENILFNLFNKIFVIVK